MNESTDVLDCPHGDRCGGCAYLGVPYPLQLQRKQDAVQRAFADFAGLRQVEAGRVEPAEPRTAYRIRAKLVVGAAGEVGLFSRDSHDIVDIPECRVLSPALALVAAAARRVLSRRQGLLEGLDLRVVDAGVLVTLIAKRGTALADLERAAAALQAACPAVVGVAASFREPDANTLLGAGHVILSGKEAEPHHLTPEAPYQLATHGAFAQAHAGQAARAYRLIEQLLQKVGVKQVLELYAGSGALALQLAKSGFTVIAVEAFAPAVQFLERAAREQDLRVQTRVGQAERVIQELVRTETAAQAVLVNPPRRGLGREVRRSLCASSVATLLYMSCDPVTLARDLAHLSLGGFRVTSLQPFDMIPHSDAVECLVLLERGALPLPTILQDGADWVAVQKSGYETLLPELGQQSLLERVRLLPGCAEAEPVQLLDREASGVCVFAKTRAAVAVLERALAEGRQEYQALARGVTHKKGRIKRTVKHRGQKAASETRYQRVRLCAGHSDLLLAPQAGVERIRQHLASVGHPLLGDASYGDEPSNRFFLHRHGLDRAFLHCRLVSLALASGALNLEAPLPGELSAVLGSASEKTASSRE